MSEDLDTCKIDFENDCTVCKDNTILQFDKTISQLENNSMCVSKSSHAYYMYVQYGSTIY